MKTRIFIFILCISLSAMSCQTSKNTGNKRRISKKNCNCSKWTYHPNENQKSVANAKV